MSFSGFSEIVIHSVYRCKLQPRANQGRTAFWTDLVLEDSSGNIIGEISLFGSGSAQVKFTDEQGKELK